MCVCLSERENEGGEDEDELLPSSIILIIAMKTPGITTAESKNIGEKSEMLQIYVGLIEFQSRTDSQINPDSLKHWFKYVLIIKWCQTFKKKNHEKLRYMMQNITVPRNIKGEQHIFPLQSLFKGVGKYIHRDEKVLK